MKKEIVNGATCFTLELADQKKARDEFFHRMAHIPGEMGRRRIYAAVAAEVFKETFPEIAEAIDLLRDEKDLKKKRPILVQGFRVGRVEHGIGKEYGNPEILKRKSRFARKERERPYTSEPEIVLALATAWLLDPSKVSGFLTLNTGYGYGDPSHNHGGYAVVTGQHGVDGVKTNIWYPDASYGSPPDFSAEVKRGTILVIPPEFNHEVEGFEPGRKLTNGGERNTAAALLEIEQDSKITPEQLEAGRDKYLLWSKHSIVDQTR